jgi:putative transposase
MPRPKRIEYNNAWVIVTNEGGLQMPLFKPNPIKNRFLSILDEMCVQFNIECHGFCLLKNSYYLLLKTPNGNLSKAMRHLNGVFTQHFNHYVSPKGSVFKHRYKSVLFQGDDSLKKLSRFIHYLPVQKRVTTSPNTYPWSSYSTFLGQYKGPLWLKSRDTLHCFKNRISDYKEYVEEGTDHETKRFFNKKKWSPMFPSSFEHPLKQLNTLLTIEIIITQTASLFNVTPIEITQSTQGRGPVNIPRYVAMYLSRIVGKHDLKDIAKAFNVSHVSTITVGIKRFEKRLSETPNLDQKVKLLTKTIGRF